MPHKIDNSRFEHKSRKGRRKNPNPNPALLENGKLKNRVLELEDEITRLKNDADPQLKADLTAANEN